MFCSFKRHSGETPEIEEAFEIIEPPRVRVAVLVEIVGAANLSRAKLADSVHKLGAAPPESSLPDPYCVVSLEDEIVHKTETITKEENPIWTVKTKSLCVIYVPCEEEKETIQTPEPSSTEDCNQAGAVITSPSTSASKDCFLVRVFDGKHRLGLVRLEYERILQCKGERLEFPVVGDANNVQVNASQQPMLALRFRRAAPEDIAFVQNVKKRGRLVSAAVTSARTLHRSLSAIEEPSHDEEAMDVDFRKVIKKNLLTFHRKRDEKTGDNLTRLQPALRRSGEDPVEWMTKAGIQQTALEPSTKWVETGHGEAGTLFLEIIGCDELPSMVS